MASMDIMTRILGDASGFINAVDKAQGRVSGFANAMSAVGGAMTDVGSKLTMGITAPIMAIGAYSMKSAIDFNQAMTFVNTIAQISGDEIAKVGDRIIDMSKTIPQSATTLGMGLYNIMSAGITNLSDAQEVLALAAKDATAGMTTADIAAKTLTSTILAFGLTVQDAQKVSDIYFKSVEKGVYTFDEFADAMGDSIGLAAQAGMSVQEYAAAFATVSQKGLDAQKTSIGINYMLLNLVKTVPIAAKEFKALGVEVGAAALKEKGFTGVLTEIVTKLGLTGVATEDLNKINEEQYEGWLLAKTGSAEATSALVKMFPSVLAMRTVLAITNDGLVRYNENLQAMGEASDGVGATQKAFDIAMGSTQNQLELTKNALFAMGKSFGDVLRPALEGILKVLRMVINFFEKLPTPIKWVVIALSLVAAAIGPILLSLGMLLQLGASLMIFLTLLPVSLAALTAKITASLGWIGVILLGISLIMGAVIALTNWLNKPAIEGVKKFTGTAVQEFDDMASKSENSFKIMALSSAKWTEELGSRVLSSLKDTTSKVIDLLMKQREEIIAGYQKMVEAGVLTPEQAKVMGETTQKLFETNIALVKAARDRIIEITQKSIEVEGRLSTDEWTEIFALQENIRKIGLKAAADNAQELLDIELQQYEGRKEISAKEMADTITAAAARRDTMRKQVEEDVALMKKSAIGALAQGEITPIDYTKMIAGIEEYSAQSTVKINAEWDVLTRRLKEMMGEQVNQIDWTLGTIQTKWETALNKWTFKDWMIRESAYAERLAENFANAFKKIGDLIPHSPAKIGPFRVAPNWAFLTKGLELELAKAANMTTKLGSLQVGAGGASYAPDFITIPVENLIIREEADFQKLSMRLAEEVERRKRIKL